MDVHQTQETMRCYFQNC